jgi:glycosyltransferase involved in cell wall biosynthesis
MTETLPPLPLTLVIPVYNERESLVALHAEIDAVARLQKLDFEIVFVDDGSRDGSWEIVKELAANDPRVHGLKFRRNFGKAAALQAGFAVARGARVVTLDADLQDDPAEIPQFFRMMDDGHDLVVGWKKVRHDPWHKVFPSRIFNGMVSRLTGVKLHDHNCGMKAYTLDVCRSIRLYGEMHRFVPVLAHAQGFRVGEVVIRHRARQFGKSKYGFKRFLRGFLDLLTVTYLTTYRMRPMHLFGSWSLFAGGLGIAFLVANLCGYDPVGISPMTALLMWLSIALFLFGLNAETHAANRTDEAFQISDRV